MNLKDLFTKVKDFVVTGKEKAVIAFLVSTVGSYIVQNGITLKDVLSWHGLQALAVGVAAHIFVYYTSTTPHA